MPPLCFVLMPFGRKSVGAAWVDFDAVYAGLIAPAVTEAGLMPLRADEERAGGIVHKQMFERLVLSDFAVADLSGANANVFYELGVRHGTRPRSTVLCFAEPTPPPFDLGPVRAIQYRLTADGAVADPDAARATLVAALRAARDVTRDSPLYELLHGFPELDHAKTDVFRDRVAYSERIKAELRAARALPDGNRQRAALQAVESRLAPLEEQEAGVLVDLMLSYRDADAHAEMLRLIDRMPIHLASAALVREQQSFALNRLGHRQQAREVLEELIRRRGPTPESNGLLGRVLKDSWREARNASRRAQAAALLDRAIATYRAGFDADWRDAYPGVNAVTLMAVRDPADPELHALLPVVRYAAERRVARGDPTYWDHAAELELAVVAGDEAAALSALGYALAEAHAPWQRASTASNLRLLREALEARGDAVGWIAALEAELAAG